MDITTLSNKSNEKHESAIHSYYRLRAKTYDRTHWSLLLGRKRIVNLLAEHNICPQRILEVGCGTGENLLNLTTQFPLTPIIGLDESEELLTKAQDRVSDFRDRIQLVEQPYLFGNMEFNGKMDMILFSYSLTMNNPKWKELIAQSAYDLKPGGIIGVVDFYNSSYSWFKKYMKNKEVRMDGHLNTFLKKHYETEHECISKAYGGLWQYFTYVGRKK